MLSYPAKFTVGHKNQGFALLITISLMTLLALVILGLLSLSSVALRRSTVDVFQAEARANARMALSLALAELQKAAGPDQRVTAVADLLTDDSSRSPQTGRARWTGVWDTSDYTPEDPTAKTFMRWMVSAGDSAGLKDDSSARQVTLEDPITVFRGTSAQGSEDPESSVVVDRVALGTNGSYAYWIEDTGVKADLAWNEGTIDDEARRQTARLSSTPGVNFEVFDGPFSGNVSHPLERDGSNSWLSAIDRVMSEAELSLAVGSTSPNQDWMRSVRHDITLGSFAVISDVKNGGLRRDLSLAFEMDGEADVTAREQPTRFNQQDGEFVGGEDHLRAGFSYTGQSSFESSSNGFAPGMPVRERYLYRVTPQDDSPFSDDLVRFNTNWRGAQPNSVVRGPNWWAMRDYYNLYKRVRGSGSSYTLNARSYFPNNSTPPLVRDGWKTDNNYRILAQPTSPWTPGFWDDEVATGGRYVYHPARANYTPVMMGMVALYSVKVTNFDGNVGDLTAVIDPLIYLWNPYNVRLQVDRYGVGLGRGHGGKFTFKVTRALRDAEGKPIQNGGQAQTETLTFGPAKTDQLIKRELQESGQQASGSLTYLVSDLTMEPGEIVIVSPGLGADPSATKYHDEASPGTNLTNSSGIEVTQLPLTTVGVGTNGTNELVRWENVKIGPGDEVRCLYDVMLHSKSDSGLTNSAEHYWIETFIPNNKSIGAGQLINPDTDAERVQIIGGNLAGKTNDGLKEHIVPFTNSLADYPDDQWPTLSLTNPPSTGKFFFGINSHMLKPSNYTDVNGTPMPNQNPVEVFSQFNPFRTGSFAQGHRTNRLNEAYCSLSKPGGINTYIQEIGVQFPPNEVRRGFWGETLHGAGGTTQVPFIDIPVAPPLSIADFANANLSLLASQPYKQVGNSHASIFVPSDTLYAQPGESARPVTSSDSCWLINDALFDRYFLSGMVADYSISGSGYRSTGSLADTLTRFFGGEPRLAEASPALAPYLPPSRTPEDIVAELDPEDPSYSSDIYQGFKRLGAYSMIQGAFNVNSTSVKAWQALLSANRDLAVQQSEGASDSASGTPFPSGGLPAAGRGAWAGFARLSDNEIEDLAVAIVDQVKARGPFMSLSDFVNRQVSSDPDLSGSGALQSALDELGLTASTKSSAGGVTPIDPSSNGYNGKPLFPGDVNLNSRQTTEGIAGDIRQADLLRPIAPRLTARSDTFRIRAYGEARDTNDKIAAQVWCEAVVQRVPDYLESTENRPWDDQNELTSDAPLSTLNETFGRRFEIRSFRWLSQDEV